jgi:hypothetical protein
MRAAIVELSGGRAGTELSAGTTPVAVWHPAQATASRASRAQASSIEGERASAAARSRTRLVRRLGDRPGESGGLVALAAEQQLLDRAQQVEVLVHVEADHHVVLEPDRRWLRVFRIGDAAAREHPEHPPRMTM